MVGRIEDENESENGNDLADSTKYETGNDLVDFQKKEVKLHFTFSTRSTARA